MSWGDIFNRYKAKGFDPSYAALKADMYEARKARNKGLVSAQDDEQRPQASLN